MLRRSVAALYSLTLQCTTSVCMCLSDEGLLLEIKLAELSTLFCMGNSSVCCDRRAPGAATHWLR